MRRPLKELEAEQTAEQLVKELNFTALPICPFETAKRHGIEVIPKSDSGPGVSGFLLRVGNSFGIGYATHIRSEGFINFTVAHELGHYFLPGHAEELFPNGDGVHQSKSGFVSSLPIEREADAFAASFLMPEFLFRKAVDDCGLGLPALQSLAERCKTSITATAIRFVGHTQDHVAAVMSVGQKIEWCYLSESLRELKGTTWPTKGTLLPPKSETASFNRNPENIDDCRTAEGASPVSDWLDGDCEVELNEDVIGLGGYGRTLTILFSDEPLSDDEEDED